MMWGPSRLCGDDEDDMGMMWGRWGRCGDDEDHGDNMGRRLRKPQTMGPTWGPSGGYGDDVGMMGMTQG